MIQSKGNQKNQIHLKFQGSPIRQELPAIKQEEGKGKRKYPFSRRRTPIHPQRQRRSPIVPVLRRTPSLHPPISNSLSITLSLSESRLIFLEFSLKERKFLHSLSATLSRIKDRGRVTELARVLVIGSEAPAEKSGEETGGVLTGPFPAVGLFVKCNPMAHVDRGMVELGEPRWSADGAVSAAPCQLVRLD